MKVTNKNSTEEIPFKDIPVTGGFIYNNEPHVKILLPDGIPVALAVKTGKTFPVTASTFVSPVEMELIY